MQARSAVDQLKARGDEVLHGLHCMETCCAADLHAPLWAEICTLRLGCSNHVERSWHADPAWPFQFDVVLVHIQGNLFGRWLAELL